MTDKAVQLIFGFIRIQYHHNLAICQLLMASPFFHHCGFPNMSLHPPPDYQHVAPFPNMETTLASRAKRGPEDDVQFVAAHPVKKFRDDGEQSQTVDQQAIGVASLTCQNSSSPLSHAGVSASPPLGRPTRGSSLPTMDNFTFPPLNSEIPSQTSQSSPLLSPRQLPPLAMPNHAHATTEMPAAGSIPQAKAIVPWQMPCLPPNLVPSNQSTSSSQSAGFVPFQPPLCEQSQAVREQDESRQSSGVTKEPGLSWAHQDNVGCQGQETSQNPGFPAIREVPGAEPHQSKSPHDASKQAEQPPAHGVVPSSSSSEAQSGLQLSAPTTKEAGSEAHSQEALDGANTQLSHPQPPPPKAPCLACEQSRQHNMFIPGHGHLTGHQPQSPYPWYVPGATQQHMHMGTGYNMAANASQNIQPRAHPTPASHAPLGYILPPHVQSQMPMTLARPFASAGMSGSESLQSILLQNQGQQVPPGQQVPHLSSTYSQQMTQPQYMQSQLHPFHQPLVLPRSFLAPSLVAPTQTAAAPPQPSPTPSIARAPTPPEPREHSPNLIVDIAETCEDSFPWEEVAQRHNVSRQKVVETFSAVVQLPLLRCTTDKRRHGNLATSRLRQYTKAKRDVEAAKASSSTSQPSPTATSAASSQAQSHGDRAILPVVWEMANTMAPLGLPPAIANGLAGAWQR